MAGITAAAAVGGDVGFGGGGRVVGDSIGWR